MAWRLARSIVTLRRELDELWPDRDRRSDGTIGDAAHASSESDHNPWVKDPSGTGVVRAIDVDVDGIDAPGLVVMWREMGAAGDVRLQFGGYVIYNRRIASSRDGWAWRPYSGKNPHTGHAHLSVSRQQAGYDSPAGWLAARGVQLPDMPTWHYEEDDVKTKLVVVKLDGNGNGWTPWDPELGRDPVPVGHVKLGPAPAADDNRDNRPDGYWPWNRGAVVGCQARAGKLIVTVEGGTPHSSPAVFVSVA